jgi:hypothetical protein
MGVGGQAGELTIVFVALRSRDRPLARRRVVAKAVAGDEPP